jgi:hypothetical protein
VDLEVALVVAVDTTHKQVLAIKLILQEVVIVRHHEFLGRLKANFGILEANHYGQRNQGMIYPTSTSKYQA